MFREQRVLVQDFGRILTSGRCHGANWFASGVTARLSRMGSTWSKPERTLVKTHGMAPRHMLWEIGTGLAAWELFANVCVPLFLREVAGEAQATVVD